ncbi:MAG: 50S ribosomal protein L1 [Candidatus Omnitrophota bacterium]|jgi:large subunit ribosomal protein L1
MVKISKRKKEMAALTAEKSSFTLEEAVGNIEKFSKVKFDETVEMHFCLNVDPKSSDQLVRGTVMLPHGTGRKIRVAVFAKGELAQKAEACGADIVGANDLIDKVANGFLDFDTVVATPDMMRDLSKLGKVLGPRGLMPSPKTGTVTNDLEKAIKEVKAGRVEFKTDKQAGIHVGIGKRSFPKEKIFENARTLIDAIQNLKPATVKGNLFKSVALSTTMGSGLKISDIQE